MGSDPVCVSGTVCFGVLVGDGGRLWEFVCAPGLHPVRSGPADLPHSADPPAERMSSTSPGTLRTFATTTTTCISTYLDEKH